MPQSNIRQLNLLIYFMLLTLGITFSVVGPVSKYIAAFFAVDTSVVGYCFALFSVSYSSAVLGNGWLLEKVGARRLIQVSCGLAVIAMLGATNAPTLGIFAGCLLFFGFGMGVILPTSFYLTLLMYGEKERAGRAIIVTFFYSTGAIIGPIMAGLALDRGIGWQGVYLGVVAMLLTIVLAAYRQRFEIAERPKASAGEFAVTWSINVYFAGLAVFCYIVSEFILNYWIVQYLMERLELGVVLASACLSLFWGCITVTRLAGRAILARVQLAHFIIVSSSIACLAYAGLHWVNSVYQAMGLLALMGIGYSGLYGTLVSFGTLQAKRPSPRLTSFFLACGSAGGILSYLLSSYLKQVCDISVVLAVGAGLIGLVPVLTAFVWQRSKPSYISKETQFSTK